MGGKPMQSGKDWKTNQHAGLRFEVGFEPGSTELKGSARNHWGNLIRLALSHYLANWQLTAAMSRMILPVKFEIYSLLLGLLEQAGHNVTKLHKHKNCAYQKKGYQPKYHVTRTVCDRFPVNLFCLAELISTIVCKSSFMKLDPDDNVFSYTSLVHAWREFKHWTCCLWAYSSLELEAIHGTSHFLCAQFTLLGCPWKKLLNGTD